MSNEDWLHALEARINQPENADSDIPSTHDPVEVGRRFVASKWKASLPPSAPTARAQPLSPESIDWDLVDPDASDRVSLQSLIDSAPLPSMNSGLESDHDMLEAPEKDLSDDWFNENPKKKAHSIAPVAMPLSDDHRDRHLVSAIDHHPVARFAYTAIVASLCIAAAAFYVWNPRPSRSFASTAIANQIPSILGAVENLKPPISVYDLPIEQILLDEVKISSSEAQSSVNPDTVALLTASTKGKSIKSADSDSHPVFEYRQASSALDTAMALSQSCKTEELPIESVRVQVTFAPTGTVTQATIDAPAYAGSPTANCILSLLRGARIQPYDGSPVSVSRTYQMR